MEIERIYRHGDVVLFRLRPETHEALRGEKIPRLTLAFGEATGHAHELHGDLEVLDPDRGSGRCLLRIHTPAVLTHPEHDRIVLEPGVYLKVHQVEYDPYRDAADRVRD